MVPVTTNQTCKKPTRHECGPKTCGVNLNEDVDFQPPRKTGEIWPTKKNTYVVSSWQNSSIWVCLTVFWGGKKNTCSSLKHLLKKQQKKNPSKLLRSWRRTIVLRWFSHALGDDSRRAPRCFCTWAACRTTGLARSWDSWDERGVTGGH